uniref:Uncharacterized protein n=1 Tax=Oryza barthii TaxID=65489 RepID=A0A0D3EJX0_9ORYZ
MCPVKALCDRLSPHSETSFPNDFGIGPPNELSERSITLKLPILVVRRPPSSSPLPRPRAAPPDQLPSRSLPYLLSPALSSRASTSLPSEPTAASVLVTEEEKEGGNGKEMRRGSGRGVMEGGAKERRREKKKVKSDKFHEASKSNGDLTIKVAVGEVEVDHICEPLKPRYWEFGSPKVIGSKVKVSKRASRRLLIKFNPLRSREMTLPEAIPQVMPSQWQQSDPARHDDKFALLMKEFLSSRREEA